ncbi:MAG: Acyl carrier protein phosphodiesterase [Verrucomicrobia bacterium]|nr:MAG: Acyl carrier protein phosphodiesterase [Verrucomicrobiota bacterium]
MAGAYLGDFVRGPVDQHQDLPPMIRQGITLHRCIDAFTDAHPVWRRSCQHLQPGRRRLGGIIIDVLYDHYLCRHWEQFSDVALDEFAQTCYQSLLSRAAWMDESARRGVRRMKDQGWLSTYSERDGIALAFRRMERRSPALAGLSGAMEDFTLHYDEIERDFLEFYPAVIEFSTRNWAQLVGK